MTAARRVIMHDPLNQWANGALHAWDFQKGMVRFNGLRVGNFGDTPGLTFTRASSAVDYAQTLDGRWMPFGIGAPRITDRGLLLEGARTNLLLYARDFTDAAWVKVNVTAALTQTGILSDANSASLLTATSGLGTILQTVVSASATRATTCFVKRVTGTGTIEFTTDGVTYTDITALISTGEFYRAEIRQAAVTNPIVGFRITTSGDAIAVDFAQLESAGGASSPILTTSASATRAADSAIVTTPVTYPLSMLAYFNCPTVFASNMTMMRVDDGSTNNYAVMFRNSTGNVSGWQTGSGGALQAQIFTSGSIDAATNYRCAGVAATDDVRAYVNGTIFATSDTSATLPASGTRIMLGIGNGTGPLFGYLQRAAIWNRALTSGEQRALT